MKEFIERTLILAKHDALQRGLVGEIIKRFEQRGFRIAGVKMIIPSEEMLGKHYPDDYNWKMNLGTKTIEVLKQKGVHTDETPEQIGDKVRAWNMAGLRGSPVIAIIFEGPHAIEIGRKIVGHTEPRTAVPGSIRGDYSTESYDLADHCKRVIRNIVHASGNRKEAENEIKIWFKPEEVFDWKKKEWEVIHGL